MRRYRNGTPYKRRNRAVEAESNATHNVASVMGNCNKTLRNVGKVCGDFRREIGMTQQDVAETVGYTQANVSAFESGKSASTLLLLYYILLGMDVQRLKDVIANGG